MKRSIMKKCAEKKSRFINEIKVQFVVITMCHQHHVEHDEEFQLSARETKKKRKKILLVANMKSN